MKYLYDYQCVLLQALCGCLLFFDFFFFPCSDADKGVSAFQAVVCIFTKVLSGQVSEMWQRCTSSALKLQGLISISGTFVMGIDIWVYPISAI